MLDIIRKHKRSWIILFLLGVGVLAFVMVGVYPQGPQESVVTIAQVNGDKITYTELEHHYQQLLNTYRQLLGGSMSPNELANLDLRSGLLDELIQQRLMVQEAHKLGLGVTDEELMQGIARNPSFQLAGRFNKNVYERALRRQGLTPGQFEAQQRDLFTIQKLYSLIQDSIPVTQDELENRYRIENQRLNLSFVSLKESDFAKDVTITEDEIKEYYEKNKNALREPLRISVEYLAYPVTHFSSEVEVTDAEIEEYYNVYRDRRFRDPEAVKLRQIFKQAPQGALSDDDRAKVRQELEAVLQEARSGADFAQLARDHSQDSSATQGGDMGFVQRGQLAPVLETAVFALKEGEISDVVDTPYGFHLLKAEEIKKEKTKTLEEAREEIVKVLEREKATDRAARAIEEDREKSLDGTPLSGIAEARKLELKQTRPFGAGEQLEEIGALEPFYETALALQPNQLSRIVAGPDTFYMIQLKERIDPHIPPLEAVRSKVEARLREGKARELAMEKARKVLDELKGKKDFESVAEAAGLSLEETGWFPRKQTAIPKIGSLQQVAMVGGLDLSKTKPLPDEPYVQDGTLYVLSLKETEAADMAAYDEEKAQLKERLLAEKRQRAIEKFLERLKAKAHIEIHPEFI